MAKFLKSIFHPTERKKSHHYENEGEEERSESPQATYRRQLSISRSGRMKQANKKRHSLALDLYGESIQIDAMDKPTSVEYHVHSPSSTAPAVLTDIDSSKTDKTNNIPDLLVIEKVPKSENTFEVAMETQLTNLSLEKSPEEEIDDAFEIIDKS